MRLVLQRVSGAGVTVGDREVARIGPGLLALVGVATDDTAADAGYLAQKTVNLRVFPDEAGKLNRSLLDAGGELLAVSQFTLLGDCRRGRRPSFTRAAAPERGQGLFDNYVAACAEAGAAVKTGEFGAQMLVDLVNDGPVTLILESTDGQAR